jgi:hypothetical protein
VPGRVFAAGAEFEAPPHQAGFGHTGGRVLAALEESGDGHRLGAGFATGGMFAQTGAPQAGTDGAGDVLLSVRSQPGSSSSS